MAKQMRRTKSAPLTRAAAVAFMAASLTACGGSSDNDERYACTDAQGIVVDDGKCDGSHGGGYFFWSYPRSAYTSGAPAVGSRLNSSSSRFASTDQAARANAGLPKTGKVGAGTVKVKSGGFGSGKAGGKGGFGGGGSNGG